jgi:hypothetical protein
MRGEKMEKFEAYLKKIGITTKPLLNRMKFAYATAMVLCPEEIEQIFVSDYYNKDNTRAYESVWFFSKNYALEALNFVNENSIDIVSTKNIYRIQLNLKDYDFKKAKPESRMKLLVYFEQQIAGDLKAAGENCDSLRNLVVNYFQKRLPK